MLQKKFEEVFHFCMHSANTEARTPLKILMQQKNYANQRCLRWAQTFGKRTFLDVKRTNN